LHSLLFVFAQEKEISMESEGWYRKVNRVAADIEGPERERQTLSDFFGLAPEDLTEEERSDFKLFLEYARKRVIHASFHKNPEHAEDPIAFLAAIESLKDTPEDQKSRLLLHDVAHAIVAFENGNQHVGTSVVSDFFKAPEGTDASDPELIAQEARAFLWVKFYGSGPLATGLLTKEGIAALRAEVQTRFAEHIPAMAARVDQSLAALDPENFDSYAKVFQEVVYGSTEPVEDGSGYLEIIKDLMEHPDPRLIKHLREVFDNRDDKKILYKQFHEICAPLIENLRGRKNSART